MSSKSSAENLRILRLMALYSVISLLMLTATVILIKSRTVSSETTVTQTEHVVSVEYVYVTNETFAETSDGASEIERDAVYTVREYMGKIGIFSSDETLIEILEVYTKTLPEADRRMLEEGFEIIGKNQLNSIIEDYTG